MKTPLSVGGMRFERGIGTHASGLGAFDAGNAGELRFHARVGVEDASPGKGSVVFQVVADGAVVFDSGRLETGDPAIPVSVDLSGRRLIELKVLDAGDGNRFDHATWADARFEFEGERPRLLPPWVRLLRHFDGAPPTPSEPSVILNSPDGRLTARIGLAADGPCLSLVRGNTEILAPSPVGVLFKDASPARGCLLGAPARSEAAARFPDPLGTGELTSRARLLSLPIQSPDAPTWRLEVHLANDGLAWRCRIPGAGARRVSGERTAFVLPESTRYWAQADTFAYEGNFKPHSAQGEEPLAIIGLPITLELPDGQFACLTEVGTTGWSGMSIAPRGRILCGVFEDDPQGWTVHGDIVTPWRVVIAAGGLTGLVNQSLVYSLADPPDPALFSEGKNAAWIRPGRAYWTWAAKGAAAAHWDTIFQTIDETAELGFQYHVIDDPWRSPGSGWHRGGRDEWESLREVCRYAAEKDVGIMVWEDSPRLRKPEVRREFFRKVAEAGAVGVKLDHFNSESQAELAFLNDCLRECARNHLMVNIHGANKPAGEERTWPNWLTREAVAGMERSGGLTRQSLAALPFTRLVTGPADFTPGVVRGRGVGPTTVSAQLALALLLRSPLLHWGDSLENYRHMPEEFLCFMRETPVVWEETRVLEPSRIGSLAILARRSGDAWWVAAFNGGEIPAAPAISLDFLSSGGWRWRLLADVSGSPLATLPACGRTRSGRSFPLALESGGGAVMVFEKAEEETERHETKEDERCGIFPALPVLPHKRPPALFDLRFKQTQKSSHN